MRFLIGERPGEFGSFSLWDSREEAEAAGRSSGPTSRSPSWGSCSHGCSRSHAAGATTMENADRPDHTPRSPRRPTGPLPPKYGAISPRHRWQAPPTLRCWGRAPGRWDGTKQPRRRRCHVATRASVGQPPRLRRRADPPLGVSPRGSRVDGLTRAPQWPRRDASPAHLPAIRPPTRCSAAPRPERKRAIVTGAASGVGAETARALARGAEVTLAVRDPRPASEPRPTSVDGRAHAGLARPSS